MSGAIHKHGRQPRRRPPATRLSTIDERFEGTVGSTRQRERHQHNVVDPSVFVEDGNELGEDGPERHNIILHLTGGGFFAHTIASDLPYLLDWSAQTGAVIVCPEYALLPQHAFPHALNQVYDVYRSLSDGTARTTLGIGADRLIVTGESVGGNLAAALCVKLCLENKVHIERIELPDAMMLSCPALSLSLESSPSRLIGVDDPVLPGGLLTAISDAYLGSASKRNPLGSPLFASDDILRDFPATLIVTSSDDPLLDDAVEFNQRLRELGVKSELKATHNMPHAFWGLGTAGFPEAVQIQKECGAFLQQRFYQKSRQ